MRRRADGTNALVEVRISGLCALQARSADYTVVSKGKRRSWDDMVSGANWELALRLAEAMAARIEARRAGGQVGVLRRFAPNGGDSQQ